MAIALKYSESRLTETIELLRKLIRVESGIICSLIILGHQIKSYQKQTIALPNSKCDRFYSPIGTLVIRAIL